MRHHPPSLEDARVALGVRVADCHPSRRHCLLESFHQRLALALLVNAAPHRLVLLLLAACRPYVGRALATAKRVALESLVKYCISCFCRADCRLKRLVRKRERTKRTGHNFASYAFRHETRQSVSCIAVAFSATPTTPRNRKTNETLPKHVHSATDAHSTTASEQALAE
jgi:hypothetical protein